MARWVPLHAAAAGVAAALGFGGTPWLTAGLAQAAFFALLIALLVSVVLASTRAPAG
jgi:uncharacterized membrane protein YtjA (UPF0391 family)